MKYFNTDFFQVCPKTGKFLGFKNMSRGMSLLAPFLGFIALLWIVFRVATKPSRASYPCVRAAYPIASGFLVYLASIGVSALLYMKAKTWFHRKKYIFAAAGIFLGLVLPILWQGDYQFLKAGNTTITPQTVNEPIGTPKGVFPGRVVWVFNPDAVNQNCTSNSKTSPWYDSTNNSLPVVDSMLSTSIRNLTGQTSDSAAWCTIFHYHNTTRGKGAVTYKAGEKIFIKINATSSWSGNFNTSDLSWNTSSSYFGISETSPVVVCAMLKQLINVVGVADTDIYIGDPMKHIYKHSYTLWHSRFPKVHYLDHDGYTNLGREKIIRDTEAGIYFSDKGTILRDSVSSTKVYPVYQDTLYTVFRTAEYVLNIPMLKGHKRAGVTMFAKNHFGSQACYENNANHLHYGLPRPNEDASAWFRPGYHKYCVQVDLMGDSLLSGKNLFYLMDALWATSYELDIPKKWKLSPFDGRYMSSMFASFDPVAIESVGYDFIFAEYGETCSWLQIEGVDDYLHQAADTTNWPTGLSYDPNGTGQHLTSMGVHEHWNDTTNKQYSQNLGTGAGIALIKASTSSSITDVQVQQNAIASTFRLYGNYPNPFNPTTTIQYVLPARSNVRIVIHNVLGQVVKELVNAEQSAGFQSAVWHANVASGIYFYHIEATSVDKSEKQFVDTKKMLLLK
jgi:hypothetical protein